MQEERVERVVFRFDCRCGELLQQTTLSPKKNLICCAHSLQGRLYAHSHTIFIARAFIAVYSISQVLSRITIIHHHFFLAQHGRPEP